MDDGGPSSGIERAAQQGTDAFEAQRLPDPMPAAPPMPIGPPTQTGIPGGPSPNDLFSRPFVMQGGWHVSPDHTSWWDGIAWVPGRPPGSSAVDDAETPGSPMAGAQAIGIVVALAGLAVIAFIAWQAFQAMPSPPPMYPGP